MSSYSVLGGGGNWVPKEVECESERTNSQNCPYKFGKITFRQWRLLAAELSSHDIFRGHLSKGRRKDARRDMCLFRSTPSPPLRC